MALDSAPSAEGTLDPAAGRMGVLALAVDVLRRPTSAMTRIALRPKYRWVAPLLALAVVSVPLALITARQAMEAAAPAMAVQVEGSAGAAGAAPAAPAEGDVAAEAAASQAAAVRAGGMIGMVFGAVFALLGAFLAPLIASGVLHFLATILGGQQSFGEVFATASWARVPLILRSVLQLVVFGAGSYDPNPAGLAGLVAPSGPALVAQRSYLEPLLGQVELWNLWYLALLVVAVSVVARFPRRRAALVVAVFAGLSVGAGMAGIALSNAMSGLMGG